MLVKLSVSYITIPLIKMLFHITLTSALWCSRRILLYPDICSCISSCICSFCCLETIDVVLIVAK